MSDIPPEHPDALSACIRDCESALLDCIRRMGTDPCAPGFRKCTDACRNSLARGRDLAKP